MHLKCIHHSCILLSSYHRCCYIQEERIVPFDKHNIILSYFFMFTVRVPFYVCLSVDFFLLLFAICSFRCASLHILFIFNLCHSFTFISNVKMVDGVWERERAFCRIQIKLENETFFLPKMLQCFHFWRFCFTNKIRPFLIHHFVCKW